MKTKNRFAVWAPEGIVGPKRIELTCQECGREFVSDTRPLGNAVLCPECEEKGGFD